ITPTAALSSVPYTPKESMNVLRFLYTEKSEFIGSAVPYDATAIHYGNWFTPRYLAIDQGTIAPMIENYRTGLLWKLFMNAPEIKNGLRKLDFKSTKYNF
ncbi:glucoamylase family protein, partial [Kaistella sp.]|uniref:glucoamylase family protein n=1 Tax=Kaistella sp. TaxID=2782235 RepID=UPI002F93A69E